MQPSRIVLVISSLLAASFVALAVASEPGTIDVDDETRSYRLHVPENLQATGDGVPLVLVFHGGGGKARGIERVTGMNAVADEHGFIACYPDAGDGVWGTIRRTTGDPSADVAFVETLVASLVAEQNVDPRRVYATGLSNGGEFSFLLGLTRPDLVAAIAPVGMHLPEAIAQNVEPAGPISVLNIVGKDDALVPYAGGTIGRSRDRVLSSDATMKILAELNGVGAAVSSALPDTVDDGTTAVRDRCEPGESGTALQRITVLGGGHTWPGGRQYMPERVIGKTSRDFVASEEIWAFFASKKVGLQGDIGD